MTLVVVSTLACLVIAALVIGYTAFPHRQEPTPGAPWLDQALERVREAVPVIQDGELDGPGPGTATDTPAGDGVVARDGATTSR